MFTRVRANGGPLINKQRVSSEGSESGWGLHSHILLLHLVEQCLTLAFFKYLIFTDWTRLYLVITSGESRHKFADMRLVQRRLFVCHFPEKRTRIIIIQTINAVGSDERRSFTDLNSATLWLRLTLLSSDEVSLSVNSAISCPRLVINPFILGANTQSSEMYLVTASML